MKLREQLINWDGKTAAYLIDVYNVEGLESDFVDRLLELLSEETLQLAATWLIKHSLGNCASFDNGQAYEFYDKVDVVNSWQARLHLLQSMPLLHVPERLKYKVVGFCRSAIEDENKFVRAWGYNGLYELAATYEEFRAGLDVVFASAMETEPASVKARLRGVQKKINTNWH